MRLIYVNSSKVTKLEQKMNNSESFLLLLKNLLKCTYEVLLPSQRYADQLRGNREANQCLCFRYTDSTIPLLPKFHASTHLLWLYSPVCVGPGRKPRRPVFSRRGSFHSDIFLHPHPTKGPGELPGMAGFTRLLAHYEVWKWRMNLLKN